ncbi:histidine kinase [Caballeronia sp. LZ062]|uniref:histidine kinase n=1 Tax=unclassified Caballeronia TaxID=2646786 RepID=UPI002860A9F1|nr:MULTISPECIES: histidine kinase [unclassified Caballeronia]MDR5873250.1 histidine kinase [Caballeronia sp. LZ062]
MDDEQECAFWRSNAKAEEASASWRILVGHRDEAIGASLTFLLALKKYEVVHATGISELRRYMASWRPHAVLLDTRLDAQSNYAFVRSLRKGDQAHRLLILAMSNICPLDSLATLKEAGFDGHVRRPCSVWRVTDLLDSHFSRRDG